MFIYKVGTRSQFSATAELSVINCSYTTETRYETRYDWQC